MLSQTLVWTVLPNGYTRSGALSLSVIVAPRLVTGGGTTALGQFSDFADWPATVAGAHGAPLSFQVAFGTHAPVAATLSGPAPTSAAWTALFDPAETQVETWQFHDYQGWNFRSFDMTNVVSYLSGLYGTLGAQAPSSPPTLLCGGEDGFSFGRNSKLNATYQSLLEASPSSDGGVVRPPGDTAVADVLGYYSREPLKTDSSGQAGPTANYRPVVPLYDFHATLAALNSYPQVLRQLGVVFDLTVPVPALFPSSGKTTVKVLPSWSSSFTKVAPPLPPVDGSYSVDATPWTACLLTPTVFRTQPLGKLDYGNGMLDLADTKRFSVTEVDVDGAGMKLNALSIKLNTVNAFHAPGGADSVGQQMALTLPALRSVGPTIVRSGWAAALQALTARQQTLNQQLEQWLQTGSGPLPTFMAEDVIRGHCIDVLCTAEAASGWRSLHQRQGTYQLGAGGPYTLTADDEGPTVPSATKDDPQAAQLVESPLLYVHEAMARWSGWSLAAPRPGSHLDPDDTAAPDSGNPPAPDPGTGSRTPPMSASFTVPDNSLPKLRFGRTYQYRARAVDLAGNGVSADDPDGATATAAVPYLRYQPVVAPALVDYATSGPGQGALVMAVLNYSDNTAVDPNGRWLFPPKATEQLCEQHGMFDGFVLGQAPDPTAPPDGSEATYDLLAGTGGAPGMDQATVSDIVGIQTDYFNGDVPYLPLIKPSLPWLADPLSAGFALQGLPGDDPALPTARTWTGGPWPQLEPAILYLQPGPTAGHAYYAGSTHTAAGEIVTLPPAATANVRLSSTLTDSSPMGVLNWMLPHFPQAAWATLRAQAQRGQLWLLTPTVTVRLVHAVLQPLLVPHFAALALAVRQPGDTAVTFTDPSFAVDHPSTGAVAVAATWTDTVDDLTLVAPDLVTTSGPVAKVTVPDPNPPLPADAPGDVLPPVAPFALTTGLGIRHDLGDTRHHLVTYSATATSRFAEFFRVTTLGNRFTGTTPVTFSGDRGIDPGSVHLYDTDDDELDDSLYTVDAAAGSIALTPAGADAYVDFSTGLSSDMTVSFVPNATTAAGAGTAVHVLSTARPAPPAIARVSPGWRLSGPTVAGSSTVKVARTGNYLRVYLERPWFSSGDGELLGVVIAPKSFNTPVPPPDPMSRLVTLMGTDPISLTDPALKLPTSPRSMGGLAAVPAVPGRSKYPNPPVLYVPEDPVTPYPVVPYPVSFDEVSGLWYADIALNFSASQAPPPGYFVRLALVRFQPYSLSGYEVSNVALATFTQPVVDRAVTVLEKSPTVLKVTVSGPGYHGYRPAPEITASNQNPTPTRVVNDYDNLFAPDYYDGRTPRAMATSLMAAELQWQDTSSGLTGELSWTTVPGADPTVLTASMSAGSVQVAWSAIMNLPVSLTSGRRLRLRISEIDYYPSLTPPTTIDTTLRRPFVVHIPLN